MPASKVFKRVLKASVPRLIINYGKLESEKVNSRKNSCRIILLSRRIVGGREKEGPRYRIRLPCHDMNRGTNMVEGIKYARRVNQRGLAIKVSQ